jgi:phosphotransferase system IIA component
MIVFKNPGLIDIKAAMTHGVSAKEGENPIGIFGTGLKYAIAVILRDGGSISIWRGNREYKFERRKKVFRGKEFNLITMNGVDTNFTDRMGLNWLPWMAYRELWSNAKDENGFVLASDDVFLGAALNDRLKPERGFTTIAVDCASIKAAHMQRTNIILDSPADFTTDRLAVHPGDSQFVFYKGIRVHEFEKQASDGKQTKTMFTYNLLGAQALTEDRTLLYPSTFKSNLTEAIIKSTSIPFLNAVLNADSVKNYIERNLNFGNFKHVTPSTAFMNVADALLQNKSLSSGALTLFKHYQDTMPGYTSPYIVTLNEAEHAVVAEAKALVRARVPEVDFDKLDVQFKSQMNSGSVVTAGKRTITLDANLIKKGSYEVAQRLLIGFVYVQGGSAAEQFCSYLLRGVWVPEELVQSKRNEAAYDPDIPF